MIDSIGRYCHPARGIYLTLSQSHARDSDIGEIPRMDDEPTPKEILKANLYALMKESDRYASLSTIEKIVKASGGVLTNGTVGRMTKGDSPTDIDRLGELAKVFNLQPWQLLVPRIRAEALPVLADRKLLDDIRELVNKPESTQPPATAAPKYTAAKQAALARRNPIKPKAPPKGRQTK
jgi:hypothetical protein